MTVLEARARVGGRARSLDVDGGAIDLGATWFWANEPVIASLTDRLEVPIFDQYLAGDALFDTGRAQQLDGNPIDAPASRFAAGAQSLFDALAARFPSGTIRLGEPVEAITAGADRVRVRARGTEIDAEHVIVAVPPALAAESIVFTPDLPSDVRRIAEHTAVWMGSTVKAVAVFDVPFWRGRGLSGSAISYAGPFREFHDHSGPDGSPAAIFGFAPAPGLPSQGDGDIAAAFRDQLVRLFGTDAGHPTSIHVANWNTEQYTQPAHTSDADTNGYGHSLLGRPVHERIHLASTETTPAYAGHLEGAFLAGLRAADTVRDGTSAASARHPAEGRGTETG